MKTFRAALRMTVFTAATLGLYSIYFVGALVLTNKIFLRQWAFEKWAHVFVKIARMKIEVVGNVPQPPFFLVSNHLSYTDVAVLRSVAKGVFVAKGEIDGWFLAGKIVRDMGTIFINRQNRRDIPRAGSQILEALDRGEGVIVFPEGTSTKGEEVLKFNSSFLEFAAQSDLPVHYASVTYRTPAGEIPASLAVSWWEDISFGAHLWRMFKVSRVEATVTFGEAPIHSKDRKELARKLWEGVSERFVPVL